MAIIKFFLSALGWAWFVLATFFAASIYAEGSIVGAVAMGVSGAFALPILWKKLANTNIWLQLHQRIAGGIVAGLVGVFLLTNTIQSQVSDKKMAQKKIENDYRASMSPEPISKTEKVPTRLTPLLEVYEAKIAGHAVIVMKQEDYPKLYRKLGKDAFGRANTMSRWAAISAAMDNRCSSQVDLVEVSDRATRDEIQWFVDCENGERFQITETMAKLTRHQLTSSTSMTAKLAENYISAPPVEPNSATLDNVSEAVVVGSCDSAVKSAMQSRGSYDPSWSYNYREHPQRGRVSVSRDFEAQNAFGATISSQYECIVDAKSMDLVSLRIREPTGWETIYSQ